MKIISSYGIEIKNMNKIFFPTLNVYNDALTLCVEIFEKEWETIEPLDDIQRKGFCDKLIHSTKDRLSKYREFDNRFPKMPSYMRRNVINSAIGYLSSYHSNLKNWEDGGKKGKQPTFQKHLNQFPTFYRDNTYLEKDIDNDIVELKLFLDNDWKYTKIKLKHTDMQYIRKHFYGKKLSTPTLEKCHKKWFLRFAIEENVKLSTIPLNQQKILAIDLGINTDATCSVMLADGTILARKFINFASDKDHICHTLNKIKKISQTSGPHNTTRLWWHLTNKNEELSHKIAKAISDYALEMQVDVIVFEHLDTKGKKKANPKQNSIYGERTRYKRLWNTKHIGKA